MTVKMLAGKISKMSLSEAGISFELDDKDESAMLRKSHACYTTLASALLIAAANKLRVDLKTDTDGRSVEILQIYP